jgi:hypothetical protein
MGTVQHVSSIGVVLVALLSTPSFADSADVRFRIGDVSIGVDIGPPPPPVVEYVPVAVPAHVWAPGYWAANGHRHVWKPGAWTRVRPGYSHVAGHWEQRGGRWLLEPPHWIARTHRQRDYDRRSRHGDDHDRGSSHRRDGRHD